VRDLKQTESLPIIMPERIDAAAALR
jgi:hypothetical protein